jgi:hypothetical protein
MPILQKGQRWPGAGRLPGQLDKLQIKRRQIQFAIRQELLRRVSLELPELVDAQLASAKGTKYLAYRDKVNGRWVAVTQEMLETGNLNDAVIEVFHREPSTAAFVSLMDRTIDKPTEHVDHTSAGGPIQISWIT